MKKIFQTAFIIIIFSKVVSAQITTTLTMQSNPTAVISDWAIQNAVINFVVTKTDPLQIPAIIKTEIKLIDGTVVASTDISKAPIITILDGTRIFFSKDVLLLEIMQFTGKYKTILERTGKLPADNYQLTVQLIQPVTFRDLSTPKTKIFNVTALQLPILFMPANNSFINKAAAQNAIIFRWSPLVPSMSVLPTYRLQVFEIIDNQQPVQALRSNQPLLDIRMRGTTQYIWRPQLAFNATDSIPSKFIWTIQTLDDRGLPAVTTDGNGESRSEPFVFKIKPSK